MDKAQIQRQWREPCRFCCRYKCGRLVPVNQMACGYCAIAERLPPEVLKRIARAKERTRRSPAADG